MFNNLLVTAEKKLSYNGLILSGTSDSVYSTTQKVVAVGPTVSGVKVGDIIEMKVENFMVRKTNNSLREDLVKEYHEVSLPIIELSSGEYMVISDRDVKYIWEV